MSYEQPPAAAGTAPPSHDPIEAKARATLADKLHQMSGNGSRLRDGFALLYAHNIRPIPAGGMPRLGIPGLRFSDGPRGVIMGYSTCFSASLPQGASWDVDLEARIGDAIGGEACAHGANLFGRVFISLLHHPAWGHLQETYGEALLPPGRDGRGPDPRRAVAHRGLCQALCPQLKRCVDEGVTAIMSTYNRVNRLPCGHHRLRCAASSRTSGASRGASSLILSIACTTARRQPWAARTWRCPSSNTTAAS